MREIPFVDVRRLHAPLRDDLLGAFARVLDSGNYVQGREVAALEEEFAAATGAPFAVATSNGTTALQLALLSLGIGPGDEVITVSNTFIATVEAISAVGATPVFADIAPGSMNIDPADVGRKLTPNTAAIIPVHLYGELAPMEELMAIAHEHNIPVIEDACQAHGASRDGVQAGCFGDVGCFSFYPTKNLGTVGEGGMLVTRHRAIAERAASLRDHGQRGRHHHVEPGYNYRLPELQAAALRVALPHLERWNQQRRRVADVYFEHLAPLGMDLPPCPTAAHVFHLFVAKVPERDQLRSYLLDRGIGTAIHYPVPIHLQPAYASLGYREGDLPRTEETVAQILSLPFHPWLTPGEIAYVGEALARYDGRLAGQTAKEAVA